MKSHWGFSDFKYLLFFFFLIFKSRPLSKGYDLIDFWKKGPQASGFGGRYPPEDTVVGSFMSP